ncbi:MAG: thioesterase family protein [Acidimicrobiales bacterium]
MLVKHMMTGSAGLSVGWDDTAEALRTGDVPVLATPRVVTLCEEAAVHALRDILAPEQTSVSSRVELAHLSAVGIGSEVRAVATLERAEGRRLVFSVSVSDGCGLVAVGKVTRVVVDRDHFIQKVH